jgi:hypothetical protein
MAQLRGYHQRKSEPRLFRPESFYRLPTEGRVWILSDGDPAGERLAISVLTKVSLHRFVRWVKCEQGKQPTDLTAEQLKACLTM